MTEIKEIKTAEVSPIKEEVELKKELLENISAGTKKISSFIDTKKRESKIQMIYLLCFLLFFLIIIVGSFGAVVYKYGINGAFDFDTISYRYDCLYEDKNITFRSVNYAKDFKEIYNTSCTFHKYKKGEGK